jgi:hypothetical protein
MNHLLLTLVLTINNYVPTDNNLEDSVAQRIQLAYNKAICTSSIGDEDVHEFTACRPICAYYDFTEAEIENKKVRRICNRMFRRDYYWGGRE